FLDELRTRTSIADVVGRKVMWDQRKSQPSKGDLWAPCPFHQEKTASFHVDDRKGYYYCFGCHAKGDAISFVRETENVEFMEAIKILAAEAGLQMPERDPEAQKKADRRDVLLDVMDQAARFFQLQLRSGAGRAAKAYLDKRGLSEDAQGRWGLGFAPDGWQGLWDHLTGKGVPAQDILDCGLAKTSERRQGGYDTFRNRIMFPIRDTRGRVIAFGGRAMDPNDNAKYLNSPETLLFDKGRTLYNHGPAREAAGKGQPLIVAEGYMDVIALAEAGFTATVAPLGTAVTEHQLALLWRMAAEPVIALDGDTAGLRAARRVIDLALPGLSAGKSLRFALLPDGQDPDDLLKAKGAPGMEAVLASAKPLIQMLWERELGAAPTETPEQKAGLDQRLRQAIGLIQDPSVKAHYGQAVKDLRWEHFRRPAGGPAKRPGPQRATAAARRAAQALGADARAMERLRETIILGVCLKRPEAIQEFEDALETLDLATDGYARLVAVLLEHAPGAEGEALAARCGDLGCAGAIESIQADRHLAVNPAVKPAADYEVVRLTLAEQLAKLHSERGLRREIEEAEEDLAYTEDEGLTWRLA
ncbi:MAG: DNA primase, partial [Shimia sp.]